jgi:hypothetical protein
MRPDRTYFYCDRVDIVLYFVFGFMFCLLATGLVLENSSASEQNGISKALACISLSGILLSCWLFRRHVRQHRIEVYDQRIRIYTRSGLFSHVGIGVIVSVVIVGLCDVAGFDPRAYGEELMIKALLLPYLVFFLVAWLKKGKWAEFDMHHSEMRVWQSSASFIMVVQRGWGGGISLAGQFSSFKKCSQFCDDMVERYHATRREFTVHEEDRIFLGIVSPCYVPIPQEETWMAVVPERLKESGGIN